MLAALALAGVVAIAAPAAADDAPPPSAPASAKKETSATPPTAEGDEGDEGGPAAPADDATEARPRKKRRGLQAIATPGDGRKFLVGIEGVVMQAPVLRTTAAQLDPRFIGRSVVMGGLGILGRYRPVPVIGLDLSVRSGSLRYTDRDDESLIATDHVMAEAGVLVYLIRAESTQLAIDGGLGGAFNRVEYELVDRPKGVQTFGSGLVRAGADVEFSFKRIAVLLSLRSYGVFTDRDRVRNRGELLEGTNARGPLPTMSTWLVGSAGIAYRF